MGTFGGVAGSATAFPLGKRMLEVVPGDSRLATLPSFRIQPRDDLTSSAWPKRADLGIDGFCGLTFELTGPLRRGGLARAAKMYCVPQAGPRRPAVVGPVVQRGVRRQRAIKHRNVQTRKPLPR